jgi:ABC-type tungstate transport system permease subunit
LVRIIATQILSCECVFYECRRDLSIPTHTGPSSNPAHLSTDPSTTIHEHFGQIFMAAISTASSPRPVRFLSRYDKSANNIKETSIWASIGQTPWSHPYSVWYHMYVEFPFQALRAAAQLGEYTLVDRGTWCSIEESVRERMMVFVSAVT